MKLTEREETLVNQITCNLFNRGLAVSDDRDPDHDTNFDYVEAELTLFMMHAKRIVYDEISDLLLNHSLQFKEIIDETQEEIPGKQQSQDSVM